MNINATLIGEIIVFSVIVVSLLSYYLAKRKTQTPTLATLVGVILSFIPPLGFIYIAVLVLKNDITSKYIKVNE